MGNQIGGGAGGGLTYTIGSHTIASSNTNWSTAFAPRKQYSFNEESMLLQDHSGGITYRVLAWHVWNDLPAMRQAWRFEVAQEGYSGGRMILAVPEAACEAYLKPGSQRPRTDESYYREQLAGRPVQDGNPPTSEEDSDMAQRHDFTFDYTGTEIAKAIDGKIKEIKAKIALATKHDLDALFEAGLVDGSKKASVLATVKTHEDKIKTWEAEKRPYAKAGVKKFSLDSEDVAHFGL